MKATSARHPAWRVAAIVLVLANIVYFAWSQGAFAVFGTQPSRFTESEPHRMERQVRPTLLQVLKEVPLVPVAAPTPVPAEPPPASEPGAASTESPASAAPPAIEPSAAPGTPGETVNPTDRIAR